jgi:triacylglycerol lipase
MLLRSRRTKITCLVALCVITSSTMFVFFAGIAVACGGIGGGGGGGCPAPSVTTGSATVNGSNSVTLRGSVNPQGCYTEYAFEYGRSSEGYPDEIYGSAGSGTSSVSVSTSAAIVQPSTSYHYRLTAWSEGGEITGGSGSFTTPAACSKPTVTTEAASFVTTDKAFLNGKVQPNGCPAEYKFEYGPVGSGSYIALHGTVGVLGPFSVSKQAVGLMPGRLYTYRLSAWSTAGNTDGSWVNFSTLPSAYDPVLFVHGYKPTSGGWNPMISSFEQAGWPGWGSYYLNDWNYTWSQSIVTTASAISTKVNHILSTTGKTKVDLITHSMGSLSARYYIKNLGGATKVDDFVSLGGLNHGTTAAKLSLPYIGCGSTPTPCNEMVENSTFLNHLNAVDETPGSVQYLTVASDCDPVVSTDSVKLNGAQKNEVWVTPTSVCLALDGHSNLRSDNTVIGMVKSFVK